MGEGVTRAVYRGSSHENPLPFLGRQDETERLQEAIRQRRSLLICGPEGIGKTALVGNALWDLSPEVRQRCFCLAEMPESRDLVCALLRALYDAGDATFRRQLEAEGASASSLGVWLRSQPISRLKGAVYRSMETQSYWVFLDHSAPLASTTARIVKELAGMRGTPVYLLARGTDRRALGRVNDLYWGNQMQLALAPLPRQAALELVEEGIRRHGLASLDLAGFREGVLHLSARIPRAILEMCELAAQPRYWHGRRIMTKLVHTDFLIRSAITVKQGHALGGGR